MWVKAELLMPKQLSFQSENLYYEVWELKNGEKEGNKHHDKNAA